MRSPHELHTSRREFPKKLVKRMFRPLFPFHSSISSCSLCVSSRHQTGPQTAKEKLTPADSSPSILIWSEECAWKDGLRRTGWGLRWNLLDFVVVTMSLVALGPINAPISVIRVTRAFRAVRILDLFSEGGGGGGLQRVHKASYIFREFDMLLSGWCRRILVYYC